MLSGSYSNTLKRRLETCIAGFAAFDDLGGPAMPYIAAWLKRGKTIWYEFVSNRLVELLDCSPAEAAETFRNSVVERHRFIRKTKRTQVREEILVGKQVKCRTKALRNDVIKGGTIEAVYKLLLKNEKRLWVKDQAVLEVFDADGVYLSLGNLTIVNRELELDEQLKAAQIALSESRRKFRERTLRDNLTGLYNTRHLYRALPRLITKSRRTRESFSLIFMDIDNFKSVVDSNGHLNASKTLRQIAGTIRKTVKTPSFGVAYGGDEFVVVLPGHTKQQAFEKAEALRIRIKKAAYLQSAGLNIKVSASFGVSTFPDDGVTPVDLLALADQAMFRVKESGKDSIRLMAAASKADSAVYARDPANMKPTP
jgi:diguanylate cyclase (GGDEF)-like protein